MDVNHTEFVRNIRHPDMTKESMNVECIVLRLKKIKPEDFSPGFISNILNQSIKICILVLRIRSGFQIQVP